MTPLASQFAKELTLPKSQRRIDDRAHVLDMIGQDLHCFDVRAIQKSITNLMDSENVWPEVETMVPHLFLPSPVTWIEWQASRRVACVVERSNKGFRLSYVSEGLFAPFSMRLCEFEESSILSHQGRITINLLEEAEVFIDPLLERVPHALPEKVNPLLASRKDYGQMVFAAQMLDSKVIQLEDACDKAKRANEAVESARTMIALSVLAIDLINTPDIIGLRQHAPHKGLVKRLNAVGSYPLRGWSEITLKHDVVRSDGVERLTGPAYHKCLHFVRSHRRHHRNGKVSVIPAHWRGDPALGIKQTRYKVVGA